MGSSGVKLQGTNPGSILRSKSIRHKSRFKASSVSLVFITRGEKNEVGNADTHGICCGPHNNNRVYILESSEKHTAVDKKLIQREKQTHPKCVNPFIVTSTG